MLIPKCPFCELTIAADDINVARDTAYCRQCGNAFSLSKLVHKADDAEAWVNDTPFADQHAPAPAPAPHVSKQPQVLRSPFMAKPYEPESAAFDLERPPHGVTYEPSNFGTKLTASRRSWVVAIGLGAVALFFDSFVSILVVQAIGHTAKELDIALPWRLPTGGFVINGENSSVPFMWLFLTPFILGGIGLTVTAIFSFFGKITITLSSNGKRGRVFTGVGSLGWWSNFNPQKVRNVVIGESFWRQHNAPQLQVHIIEKNGRTIKFGSMLAEERRNYLCFALRKLCVKNPKSR